MSTILEEGIGFGGKDDQTTDTAWERVKDKYPQSPYTSSYVNGHELNKSGLVDLNPALKELKEKREQSMNEQVSEKKNTIQQKVSSVFPYEKSFQSEFTSSLKGVPEDKKYKKPAGFDETKKLMETFHKRMAKYAKHLSLEGATAICVQLSLHSPATIYVGQLPKTDQEIIHEMVKDTPFTNSNKFYVTMDEVQDFKVIFSDDNEEGSIFYLFNTVIHPPLNRSVDIPVENDKDTILIAGKKFPSKDKLQRLAGVPVPKPEDVLEEPFQKRQPVSGRNAYELRSDIMQMAVDYGCYSKRNIDPDEIVNIARKFYSFVENKK